MDQIEAKIHGKPGEQERIRVRLIDYYPAAVLATRDAKLISLVFAHQQHKQAHKL